MDRDQALIKKILRAARDYQSNIIAPAMLARLLRDQHGVLVVNDHIQHCREAGYLRVIPPAEEDDDDTYYVALTSKGHDYLDSLPKGSAGFPPPQT